MCNWAWMVNREREEGFFFPCYGLLKILFQLLVEEVYLLYSLYYIKLLLAHVYARGICIVLFFKGFFIVWKSLELDEGT